MRVTVVVHGATVFLFLLFQLLPPSLTQSDFYDTLPPFPPSFLILLYSYGGSIGSDADLSIASFVSGGSGGGSYYTYSSTGSGETSITSTHIPQTQTPSPLLLSPANSIMNMTTNDTGNNTYNKMIFATMTTFHKIGTGYVFSKLLPL